ncbi:RNA polymerase III subunit GL b isoform X3 [Ictalurus furcatus]|uniref:RNA polymerase III subunit GL b isoform X3 n=1 Tax=Ictalurus furcatus TaxID=66913 RepID=UPI00234FC9E1|nr:RNA polymerase III subunit GL b isoform X3 [Ictalurus furcatus]
MAGRGRSRGRAQLSFPVEAVGIGKGENLPPSTVQPTPLFPPLEHKPVPLQTGEEAEYMLALKQEFRGAMKTLPFYIRPAAPKKDVERYSDKYQNVEPSDNTIEWSPGRAVIPKNSKQPRVDKEIIRKLETLEKKEEEVSSDEEEGEKKKTEDEEAEGEEEYDEEEFEEETDYIMSYFDNGEDFGADSDDNMDEAVY